MTDLATRIADVKKKAETLCKDDGTTEGWLDAERLWKMGFGYNQAHYIAAVSPDLFIEMADEIDRLKAQLEKAREALEPFAKDAQRNLSSVDDGKGLTIVYQQYAPLGGVGHIKVGHLRTAARVHAELAELQATTTPASPGSSESA